MLQEHRAQGADQQSLCAFHEPLAGFFSVAQLSGHQRKRLVEVWIGLGSCCLDALYNHDELVANQSFDAVLYDRLQVPINATTEANHAHNC